MAKTVKELIEKFNLENPLQTEIDCACNSGYTEYKYCFCEWLEIKKQELRNILQAHENEISEKDKLIASAEYRIESAYEKKLIEKDKEIEWLHNNWINKQDELTKLQDRELYKEDFDELFKCIDCNIISEIGGYCFYCECDDEVILYKYFLKDNSKYELLPSKEELK